MVVREDVRSSCKMPGRVGVNLRASACLHQGDRKYMEDEFVVAYQRTADKKDIEYSFFGIFDGHGGKEAAHFAKDHLMDNIVSQRAFWSDDDDDVLQAIREGFFQTHMAMWKELDKWPRTASGWPSTSGTTASVAFIRRQKIYIGHVGDSGICLGYEDPSQGHLWMGQHLTRDHKPESSQEKSRILRCGGKVVNKAGVPRVVWNRPKRGHKGPVRRSTPMDEIPFLAVARSLGDLWSYNPISNQFVVSPIPDVHVHPIDISSHRCLIFGTDGLWNVMSPYMAVNTAFCTEKNNENHYLGIKTPCGIPRMWVNPSRSVVKGALDRYSRCKLRADNTSAIVVFLDPPGRPKREVLLLRKGLSTTKSLDEPATAESATTANTSTSSDCKVQVHVYNLGKNINPSSPKVPHGVLWIKERIPEKWQENEDGNTSQTPSKGDNLSSEEALRRGPDCGRVLTPMQKGLARAVAGALGEQAPTPGSSEESLLRRAVGGDVPSSPPPLLSSSLSNLPPCTPSSPSSPSFRSASSPNLSSTVGLRSTVKVSSDSCGHSARLSLCSATPVTLRKSHSLVHHRPSHSTSAEGSNAAVTHRAKSLSVSDVASVSGSSVCSSNKSLKRDRDDDDQSQPQSKKMGSLCACGNVLAAHPSKNASSHSLLQSDTRERTNVDKSLGQSAGICCGSCTSSNSSLKSSKLKAVQDSSSLSLRKRDDIQIPVISSSTFVSSKTSISSLPPSPLLVDDTDIPASNLSPSSARSIVKDKFKRSSSRGDSHDTLAKEPPVKRVASENRRTRSGIPLSCSSLLPPSVASAINNNTWCSDVKAGTSRSSGRGGTDGADERTVSGHGLESGAASRVLKSVNRGSPTEGNKLLKVGQPSVVKSEQGKASKYAKLLSPRRKRTHSVPSLSSGADGTAPPPKKKSAKMHLRSGKPMITRSQEKTCKNVRAK